MRLSPDGRPDSHPSLSPLSYPPKALGWSSAGKRHGNGVRQEVTIGDRQIGNGPQCTEVGLLVSGRRWIVGARTHTGGSSRCGGCRRWATCAHSVSSSPATSTGSVSDNRNRGWSRRCRVRSRWSSIPAAGRRHLATAVSPMYHVRGQAKKPRPGGLSYDHLLTRVAQ